MEPLLTPRPLVDSGTLNAWVLYHVEEPVKLHVPHAKTLSPVPHVRLLRHVVPDIRTHGQQEMQDLMELEAPICIPLLLREQSQRRLGRRVNFRLRWVTDGPCRRVMRRRCVTLHSNAALSLCRVKEASILASHSYSSYLLSRSLTRSTSLWKPSRTTFMESGHTPPNASMIV